MCRLLNQLMTLCRLFVCGFIVSDELINLHVWYLLFLLNNYNFTLNKQSIWFASHCTESVNMQHLNTIFFYSNCLFILNAFFICTSAQASLFCEHLACVCSCHYYLTSPGPYRTHLFAHLICNTVCTFHLYVINTNVPLFGH